MVLSIVLIGICVQVIPVSAMEGPHGNYSAVTTKCAACHRPHTGTKYPYVKGDGVDTTLGNPTFYDIADLCLSCHKDGTGANTNVYAGYFMGLAGPSDSGSILDPTSNPWPFEPTNTALLGTKNAGLNGGGFVTAKPYWGLATTDLSGISSSDAYRLPYNGRTKRGVAWVDVHSSHVDESSGYSPVRHFNHASQDAIPTTSHHNAMDDTKSWTVWGSLKFVTCCVPPYTGPGMIVTLTCTTCHDQHGSAHYRILRDSMSGSPYYSNFTWQTQLNEYGKPRTSEYPDTDSPIRSWESEFTPGGLTKDYTSYSYRAYRPSGSATSDITISDFCKSCHSQYYSSNEVPASSEASKPSFATYDAGDGLGAITRYRHFTEATIDTAPGGCGSEPAASNGGCSSFNLNKWIQLPLAASTADAGGLRNGYLIYEASIDGTKDKIVCTTCHVAHGTTASMSLGSRVGPTSLSSATGSDPGRSTLLRLDNRGVCEDCHGWSPNKNELGQVCSNDYGDYQADCVNDLGAPVGD